VEFKYRKYICSLSVITALFLPLSVYCQGWQKLNGPSGGNFDHLECSDSVIVVSIVNKGFWFSNNLGSSWQGLPYAGRICSILHEHDFWVVVSDDSVYYSSDNFHTLHSADYPGGNAESAYLKNGKIFLSGYWPGNIFTSDTARTWNTMPFAFKQMAIEGSVWYVSDYSGFKISRDNGITWQNDSTIAGNNQILLTDSNEAWVGNAYNLYFSNDYGVTWSIRYTAPYNLTFLKKYGSTLYLSYYSYLLQSNDNGISWTQMPQVFPAYDYLNIGVSQGIFFTALPYGIYRSNDGIHWTKKSDGILQQEIKQLKIKDGLLLYIAPGEMGYSADYGSTWHECTTIDSSINGFKSFEYSNGVLFGVDWHRGVYFSSDTGRSWTKLAIDNSYFTGDLLYDGLTLILPQLAFSEKIYRTDDLGATWNDFYIGPFSGSGFGIQRVVKSPQALIYSRNNVYRSLDDGISWSNTGLPSAQYNELSFSGTYFYAMCYGAVYRGDATGSVWTNVYPSCNEMYDESITSKNNEVFFSCGSVIFYSADDGNTWAQVDSFQYAAAKLFYDPPYLYVGTKDESMFRKQLGHPLSVLSDAKRKMEINIFPNPNNGSFNIQTLKPIELKIYNSFGQLVQTQVINQESSIINLTGQAKGIYFLEMGDERRKIVLN
jgi:photosystem II stability/assembly factor-like uncharacterized protein